MSACWATEGSHVWAWEVAICLGSVPRQVLISADWLLPPQFCSMTSASNVVLLRVWTLRNPTKIQQLGEREG